MKNKQNKNIEIINTRKYKDINLYLRFSIENKKLLKEKIALLCKMVGDVSQNYPTKLQMTRRRDMLYGISCNTSYKVRANIITFSLHFSFINPKFVATTIDEYNDYIKEVLYNSIIDDKTLDEAKRTIKAALARKIDKPSSLVNERFIEIVSRDNDAFNIYSENKTFIKNIDKIKLKDVVKTYKDIVNNAQLNIYLCGDINNKIISKLTNYNFDNRKQVKLKNTKIICKQKKRIVDRKDISQTYLAVVYSCPYNKNHKDYFAWFIANIFLGVVPTSLLFSELREKMSLCYDVRCIDYKHEGLVKIITSIDSKNVDIAIKEIKKQVERLINKDYDLSQLEIAKTLMCNTLMGTYDDLDALVNYYYESLLSNFNYSIEEYSNNLMKVTADDISQVIKKYNHYFDYVLLGNKHE